MWIFAAQSCGMGQQSIVALFLRTKWEKNFHGGIAVSNQIKPISTSQKRGLRTTCHLILMLILIVWIGLPTVAWPSPVSLTTQAGESAHGAGQSADEKLALEPGKPVERELSGDQSHFYEVSMASGQYLMISVTERGIDLLVALFTPDGMKLWEVNREHVYVWPEII